MLTSFLKSNIKYNKSRFDQIFGILSRRPDSGLKIKKSSYYLVHVGVFCSTPEDVPSGLFGGVTPAGNTQHAAHRGQHSTSA
jgi:hypothetical protein